MKKLLIITAIVLLLATSLIVLTTIIGESKLSDETWKDINTLRWKHYSNNCITYNTLYCGVISDFDYKWWSFHFEDGKLFVETQDGK